MNNTSTTLAFADGEYDFRLGLAQIKELQSKCNIGIGGLFARLMKGRFDFEDKTVALPHQSEFYVEDLIEVLRQGLIGGGRGTVDGEEIKVTPAVAQRLIDAYVVEQDFMSAWEVAAAIMSARIIGFDPPKKDQPADERAGTTAETAD